MNAGPRGGLLPSQLQPKTGADYQLQPQNEVPRATTCHQVPRADAHTHFYMECDVMLAVYIRTKRA